MYPETLPLISDFKKEYKFLWYISANMSDASGTFLEGVLNSSGHIVDFASKELSEGSTLYNAVVANPLFSGYISQLAQTVNLPDDEFDSETIPQGPVDYDMPKRVKLEDINVTYLEDSLESVYNFHKAWFQAIRCGKGIGINSPSLFSASAKYIPFEETMTASEYLIFKNQFTQKANSFLSSDFVTPKLPLTAKISSVTSYPKIWPKKIHRTAANHMGEDIATVEVTYGRIPVFEKKHTPLQIWDGTIWSNTNLNPFNF